VDDLTVLGNTNLGDGNDNLQVNSGTGTVNIQTTTGAITVSSTNGAITISTTSGALTLSGDTFSLAGTTSGSITTPTWTVNTAGTAWFAGSVDIDTNLNVDGDTTLNGNVDLGDAFADTISFLGSVDTTVLPNQNNQYDLGSNTYKWRTGYFGTSVIVGSTVTIDTDSVIASGALTVQSGTNYALTLNAPGTGTLAIDAGSGTLDVDANTIDIDATAGITVNSATLAITATTSGSITTPTWSIDTSGNANFDGTVTIGTGTVTITSTAGASTISATSPLTIQTTDAGENIAITAAGAGTVTIESVVIDGSTVDVGTGGTLQFSSANTLTWNSGTGRFVFNRPVQVGTSIVIDGGTDTISTTAGNLEIDAAGGTTTIDDALTVTGATNLQSTLDVAGDFDVNSGKFTVDAATGNTAVAGTLTVTGAAALQSSLTVTGLANLNGGIDVNSGKFTVDAATGNVHTDGNLDVDGTFTLGTGTMTMSSTAGASTISASSALTIQTTSGAITVQSATGQDVTLSAPGAGNVNLNADTGDIQITGDVMPTLDSNYRLGSQSNRWHSLYLGNALQIVQSATNYITVDITGISSTGVALTIASDSGTGISINSGNNVVDFSGDSLQNINIVYADQLLPSGTNKYIGSAGSHWSQLHVDTAWVYGSLSMGGNIDLGGNYIYDSTGNVQLNDAVDISGTLTLTAASPSIATAAGANTLTIGDAADTINVPGNLDVDGTLTVGTTITITGSQISTDAANQLTLVSGSGDVKVNDGLTVTGATTLSGNLDLSNNNINNVGTLSANTINVGTLSVTSSLSIPAGSIGTTELASGTVETILAFNGGSSTVPAGVATRYVGFGSLSAASDDATIVLPRGGTLKNLYVWTDAAVNTGITVTVYKNGVATGLTVTLSGGVTSGSDLVNTVAVSAGDIIYIEVSSAAGEAGGQQIAVSLVLSYP
jgi:hypothetical protein